MFLDFGIDFDLAGRYYNELLRPRAGRGLLDPLALGLIPPLEGLYRKDLELPLLWDRIRGMNAYRKLDRADGRPAVDAVLISHAHLDHNGDVSYLDGAVPIVCTRVSAAIVRAMQVTGMTSLEREMVYSSARVDKGGILGSGDGYQLRPFQFSGRGARRRRARILGERRRREPQGDAHRRRGCTSRARLQE